MTTIIHADVNGLGNPARIHLTGDQDLDITTVCGLIAGLYADQAIADQAYEAEKFLTLVMGKVQRSLFRPE